MVHVFFSFSTGLKAPLTVPKGTKQSYLDHVKSVEKALGLKRSKYKDNPVHWDFKRDFPGIDNEVLCKTVEEHNAWVRQCYENFEFWSEHPFTVGKGHQDTYPNTGYPVGWESEQITPEDAQIFWHGFQLLDVPVHKWTVDYERQRMEHLYEVMRGNENEGVNFEVKKLTPKQAGAVIWLFSNFFPHGDTLRLEVPNGRDSLYSSYDGGYDWCEKCGAMCPEDVPDCRKRGCPLIKEYRENGDL